MDFEMRTLTDEETWEIERRLEGFDRRHVHQEISGHIQIGTFREGRLIGGADAGMTAFKILYISTLFVDEDYRGLGIGRRLMAEVEIRAKALGANMIRLDTFNFQGRDFYRTLGFEEVGSYENEADGFSEHFFLKRL